MAGALARLAVQVHQGPETARLAADDRDHERQPECSGADERLGCPSHADPDRQRLLQRSRIDSLSRQCRPGSTALSTLTALVSRIRSVRAAAAPRMTAGAESRNSRR